MSKAKTSVADEAIGKALIADLSSKKREMLYWACADVAHRNGWPLPEVERVASDLRRDGKIAIVGDGWTVVS